MEEYKQFRDTDYYVSKDGVVINRKTNREVKGHKTNHGYTLFKIGGRDGENITLSRMVAEVWLGDVEGMEVHHIDGNKDNNNISNLQILTPLQHTRKHQGYMAIAQFTDEWELVRLYNTVREAEVFNGIRFSGKKDYKPSPITPLCKTRNFYWLFFVLSEKDINFVAKNVADRDACDEMMLQVIERELVKSQRGSRVWVPYAPQKKRIPRKKALQGYEYTAQ